VVLVTVAHVATLSGLALLASYRRCYMFLASLVSWTSSGSWVSLLQLHASSSKGLPAGNLTLLHIAWPPRSFFEILVEVSVTQ
jgi:hypothetical protein